MIKHSGKKCTPEEMEEMIGACADNMHLTSGGKRLLLFYATCKGGFHPAKKLVQKETGINPAHLYKYKKELEDLGIIYSSAEQRTIIVDWQRIRLYTTLDPNMTDKHRRHTTVSASMNFSGKKIGTLNKRYVQRAVGRILTPAQQHFYRAVDEMTEAEWNALMWAMGSKIPEPMEIPEPEHEHEEMLVPVDPAYKNYYGEIHLPF